MLLTGERVEDVRGGALRILRTAEKQVSERIDPQCRYRLIAHTPQ
jgi:hypothetical protein